MVRRLLFLLGFVVVVTAVPARGQNFFEALADAIDAAADEGGGGDYYYEYEYQQPNRPNWNNQNQNWNNPNWNNNNYVRPTYPQQQKIWNGSYWEIVPVNPAPGRVVYPQTTVVPSTTVYPSTTISPATTITSAAVAANTLPYKGPGVTIKLEAEEGGSVTYLVDNKENATIQAGQQQTLTTKGRYEIRFSRGTAGDGRSFGEARYTLTEGNYSFKVTDKGWELLRDKEQPALVTTQAPATSPSGIKTNSLPPKTAPTATPATTPVPAAPAANAIPAAPAAAPAANVIPAAPAAAPAAVPPAPAAPPAATAG